MGYFVVFCCGTISLVLHKTDNERREQSIPMNSSQRQLLKAFIMKKEEEALGSSQSEERREILETGAVDCLFGLHTLFEKLLARQSAPGEEKEMGDGNITSTVSAAGWQQALLNQKHHTSVCLDEEEARIARMLFDAADLDSNHSISFPEFAMLAVLLSATDASDADAQVCCSRPRTRLHCRVDAVVTLRTCCLTPCFRLSFFAVSWQVIVASGNTIKNTMSTRTPLGRLF